MTARDLKELSQADALRLVEDPEEAASYRERLTPWVAGEMDQVIRIRPEMVTGFELVPAVSWNDARHAAGNAFDVTRGG